MIYSVVRARRFPMEGHQLISYMKNVKTIAQRKGSNEAIEYDGQFRLQRLPEGVAWDDFQYDLYEECQSYCESKRKRAQKPFRAGRRGESVPSFCFAFNKGNCSRPNCRYSHLCSKCKRPGHKSTGFTDPTSNYLVSKHMRGVAKHRPNIDTRSPLSKCHVTKSKIKLTFLSYKHSTGRPFKLYIQPTGGSTCPHMFLKEYIKLRGHDGRPLFRFSFKLPLSRSYFSSMLKKAATAAKLDAKQISPHSFRIGATTWAAKRGFST